MTFKGKIVSKMSLPSWTRGPKLADPQARSFVKFLSQHFEATV